MNRYPVWKYAIILIALVVGGLYTLPNFFGKSPAVQVSAAKAGNLLDGETLSRVEQAVQAAGIPIQALSLDDGTIRVRFGSTEDQLKAKDAIELALRAESGHSAHVVALNRISRSPDWLTSLHAVPCTWVWT